MKIIFKIHFYIFILLHFYSNLNGQIVTFSPITPSYVTDNHTAAGFLTALDNGKIIHIFRFDPGISGNHVGNNAFIAMRSSVDGGQNWTEPVPIYNDEYDDRNVIGGRTENGRIIVFFRRHNAPTAETVDCKMMYSDNEGQTWTVETMDIAPALSAQTHQMIYVEDRGYMQAFYNSYYFDVRFSSDGITWDSITYAWDYQQSNEFFTTEVSFAYAGNGKMIGLIRNDNLGPHYQVTSSDTGRTWTEPVLTNIAAPYFSPSPLIFYDNEDDKLYVVNVDRRNENGFAAQDSKTWIYQNHIDDVFNSPTNYTLIQQFDRPEPNWYRTFGYPTYCKKANGNYLIIFAESSKIGSNEDAHLYQFDIIRNPISIEQESISSKFSIYPNPANDKIICESFVDDLHNLKLYNINGKLILETKSISNLSLKNIKPGIYFYSVLEGDKQLFIDKLIHQ